MYKAALPLVVAIALTGCPAKLTPAADPTSTAPSAAAPKPVASPQAAAAAPAAAAGPGTEMKIADVFAQKDSLAGKRVTVRGKVVKFNANILGSNWVHVQDGSGGTGTNDLTVTTKAIVAVGDMAQVTGSITRNKDFGAGYKFDVIMENAQVTKQ